MPSLQNIRRFEFWLIISAAIAYITRRLFMMAYQFDNDVTFAEGSNISNIIIWKNLASYNHEINTILPTILSGFLFLSAWYLFHYQVVTRWKSKGDEQKLFITYSIFTFICVLSSIFIYHYFKLYWRFQNNGHGHIIGFKVFSLFRKLHVITNTFAGIVVLFMYEGVAQIYYYTNDLYQKHKQLKHFVLANTILAIAVTCILFWVFFGTIANLVLGANGSVGSLVIIFLSGILHLLFFQIIIPYFSKFNYEKVDSFLKILISFGLYLTISGVILAVWVNINIGDFHDYFNYYIFPNLLGLGSAIGRWYFFEEKTKLQTKISNNEAELSNLRSQINPHFLFNALNTLYSVSLKENAEKTSDGIQKLGDMMRFMLNENHQDRIPLSKEIEYLSNYIDIQRMRIDESHHIEIKVNIENPERAIFIAPMLLNPFIENAFKHGISFRNPSWIYITLTHDAQKLYFKVHNSIHQKEENDAFSRGDEPTENTGIGLENVKKRLELIYPNRYTLDIQASDNDYFVSLILGIY